MNIHKKIIQSLHLAVVLIFPGTVFAGSCGENIKCIWAFGNSITKHAPAPAIDWLGDWGMAATEQQKDYVHQLALLLSSSGNALKWAGHRENLVSLEESPGTFKLPAYLGRFARQADIVVIELGDNFSPKKASIDQFAVAYLQLARASKPGNGILICVSTWWASSIKNTAISESCNAAGGLYVDISDLNKEPINQAGSQRKVVNAGVASHPSDQGMRAIAERIFHAIPDSHK